MHREMLRAGCNFQVILIVSLKSLYITYTQSARQVWIFPERFMPPAPSRIPENIDIWRPERKPLVDIHVLSFLLHVKFRAGFC